MLIKKKSAKSKVFYVSCANWDIVVTEASNHEDAATLAVEEAHLEIGERMMLSPYITTIDMTTLSSKFDLDICSEMHDTVKILSNAGLHESARKYKKIIGLL